MRHWTNWHKTFARLSVFVTLAIGFASAQNPSYQLVATGVTSSGADLPLGLNNWGTIALFNPSTNHATLSDGLLLDMGALNNSPSYSVGVAVNARFHVPGWSLVNGRTNAFSGAYNVPSTDLGTLGGVSSWAYGINDNDVIVGAAVTSTGATHAFSFNGQMKDLGAFKGGYSEARGINNAGQIVGDSTTVVNQRFHAFIITGTNMRDLGTLGGTDSYGLGINAAGQAVGYSYTAGNTAIHPFLFTTSMQDLGTLGGNTSEATAINSLGQVVGWSLTSTGAKHAFLFNGTTLVDLNSIVTNLNGWTLNSAWAINDAGEIAGYATDANNQGQIYRLEPVVASNCVPNPYATQFADVNGDGLADEIAVNDNSIVVELSNGDVFQGGLAWSTVPFFGVYHIDGLTKGNAFFADVDGDGSADAIAVNDTSTVVRRSNSAQFLSTTETWASGLIARAYHYSGVSHPNIYFVDVNHDGAADAVSVDDNGVWVQLADKVNHVFGPATNWTGTAFYGSNGTFFADVNGDGMADAIAVNHNQFGAALISVRLSTGSGFAAPQSAPALGYLPTAFADITGDGAADDIMNRGSSGLWVGPSAFGSFNFVKNPAWSSPAFYGDYATYYAEVDGNPYVRAADAIAFNHDGIYVAPSLGTSFGAAYSWSDPYLIYGTHDPICH